MADISALAKLLESEIRRLDQLRESETRRVDGQFEAQETAVNAALVAQEKATSAALLSSERAVTKAEEGQLRVNSSQNEFRGALADQAAKLMPRQEFESVVREIRGLLSVNADAIADLRSRLDVGPPSLATLQTRSDENVGRRAGSADTQKLVFALFGAAIAGLPLLVVYLANAPK